MPPPPLLRWSQMSDEQRRAAIKQLGAQLKELERRCDQAIRRANNDAHPRKDS
jgi:predicted Fe-S protein YdhL (DUF1289 family)